MKNIILTLTINLLSIGLFSQSITDKQLVYRNFKTFETEKDSSQYLKNWGKYQNDLLNQMLSPAFQIEYNFQTDSLLALEYNKDEKHPRAINCFTKKTAVKIDCINGRSREFKNYLPSKYKKFKAYERMPDLDKKIADIPTKAYICKSKKGWNKVWLADQTVVPFKNCPLFIDDKLILRQETYYFNSLTRVMELKARETIEEMPFDETIKYHTKTNIQPKYSPIVQNSQLSDTPLKVGDTVPNFYFRQIFNDQLTDYNSKSQHSDYTAIEFWGSWCIPCLLATDSIKKMANVYDKKKLTIISFNTRDRQIEKVKQLIQNKEMNWEHAYSTKKIVDILNKDHSYPKMVLIDKNRKILFIGHPSLDYKKITSLIR